MERFGRYITGAAEAAGYNDRKPRKLREAVGAGAVVDHRRCAVRGLDGFVAIPRAAEAAGYNNGKPRKLREAVAAGSVAPPG